LIEIFVLSIYQEFPPYRHAGLDPASSKKSILVLSSLLYRKPIYATI